jgi:riboflavin synthase
MFTGIIQEIGIVRGAVNRGGNLAIEIEARKTAPRLDIGASVSINGACQTVTSKDEQHFKVEAIKETLDRTNLGELRAGSRVNLEAPLSMNDLLHGHLVQGHIDCTSRIRDIGPIEGSTILTFDLPMEYKKYLIEKGSIAIDGVSLTIMDISSGAFRVSIIPHTMSSTIFQYLKAGDSVNLEFDMLAKYIENMMSPEGSKITMEFLKEHGY